MNSFRNYRRLILFVAAFVLLLLAGLFLRFCNVPPFIPPNAPITRAAATLTPTDAPTHIPSRTLTPQPTNTPQEIHPPTVENPLPIPDTRTATLAPTETPTAIVSLTNSPSITPPASVSPTPTAKQIATTVPGRPKKLPGTGGTFDPLTPLLLFSLAGVLLIVLGVRLMRQGEDAA